ncbi:MAG: hypothetical protein ACQEQF_10155 [Bacillota bacterium]
MDLERISGIVGEGDDLSPEAIRDIIKFVKKAEDGIKEGKNFRKNST